MNSTLIGVIPYIDTLKRFLYQIVIEDFGISETFRNGLQPDPELLETEDDYFNAIQSMNEHSLKEFLGDEYIPSQLFYFSSGNESGPINWSDKAPAPVLFSGIKQVSFDKGGLIVLEKFCSQIYELYTPEGKKLLGPCHDLEIGSDGFIESRSSSSPFWEYFQYSDGELNEFQVQGPFEPIPTFPYLHDRDLIPEMIDSGHYQAYYPTQETLNQLNTENIVDFIEEHPHSWRGTKEIYGQDVEIAGEIVKRNYLAFTLLPEDMKRNPELLLDVSIVPSLWELILPFIPFPLPEDDRLPDMEHGTFFDKIVPSSSNESNKEDSNIERLDDLPF